MNSIIISSFFLVLLCCLSNNSVSSSAISQLEVASTPSSSQPSNIANTNYNDDAPTTTSTTYSNTILQQTTSTQDAYVKASPLSVAAVCNDGIVMISLHYNVDEEEDVELASSAANNEEEDSTELASEKAQEILDIMSNDDTAYTALVEKKSIDHIQQQKQVANKVFRDLPLSTRGPLRIEPIYERSTSSSGSGEPPPMALLTAGWRTDGITLCDAARELISEEVRLYCLPTLVGISNDEEKDMSIIESGQDGKLIKNKHSNLGVVVKKDAILDNNMTQEHHQQEQSSNSYYGRRIAEGLSYYLSKCSFSEGIRSLSTIGLLACGTATVTKEGSRGSSSGSLYLVDATGIHSVRAHAIGNGSNNIHKRIVYVDFNTMDCHEGLRVLLRLIAEEGGLVSKADSLSPEDSKENAQEGKLLQDVKTSSIMAKPAFLTKRKSQKKDEKEVVDQTASQPSSSWAIPSNTAVELGVIQSGDGRMRRIRLSSLFS